MTSRQTEWSDFFNDHAPVYETNCFTKNTLAEVDFLVEALGLSPGQAVLDVGCGTGRHSIELARRGYRVTGLDVSPGMLAEARRHAADAGVEVAWVQADATQLCGLGPVDAAICLCEGAFGLLNGGDDPIAQPLAQAFQPVVRSRKPQAGKPVPPRLRHVFMHVLRPSCAASSRARRAG